MSVTPDELSAAIRTVRDGLTAGPASWIVATSLDHLQAEPDVLAAIAAALDGWRPWTPTENGEPPPGVGPGDLIEARSRAGGEGTRPADSWRWDDSFGPAWPTDIVAWRPART